MSTKTQERAPRDVAYRTVREHIVELATRPGVADLPVPSCPEWTVRDVVAHVVGNCVWRVEETVTDQSLPELVEMWQRAGKVVDPRIAGGEDVMLLTMDTFTHELDLRAALGVTQPEEHPAYPWSFDVVVGGLSWSLSTRGLPTLRLDCGVEEWIVGPGEPVAEVAAASRYELYRSLSGRRTRAQIGALAWSEDPSRWLPGFYWGPFSEPAGPGD